MRTPIALSLLLVSHGLAATGADHAAKMAASLELFTGEVRSILIENCVECHGGERTRSAFDLTDRDSLLAGGDQGNAVIPGQPAASPLLDYLRHSQEPHMPPKRPPLSGSSIEAIERWIRLGAAYDRPLVEGGDRPAGPMQVTDDDRAYWAFAPLRTDFGDKQSIDDFLGEPDARAPDPVLARRLHFDLVGLPPAFEEVLFFLAPDSADNYGLLVDRLLDSPQFGEKWARHWLDIARFAESHGFEHDYDRKHAFHFRDFVIRAFNDDLPYDQFVRWQLAGDQLEPENPLAMMATGFLGAGVYPTQITSSEAERVRYDAMDDMLATTGSAMLATTIGCARCHDHKYDPIPTRDYYQMLSAFTTTVRSDVDLDLGLLDRAKAAEHAAEREAVDAKIAAYESGPLVAALTGWQKSLAEADLEDSEGEAWHVLAAESITSAHGAGFEPLPDGSYLATGTSPDKDTYTVVANSPFGGATALRLEALSHESMVRGGPGRAANGNIQLTGVRVSVGGEELTLRNTRATFQQNSGNLSVASAIDGKSNTGWALDPQFGKDHAAIFEIAETGAIKAGAAVTVMLEFQGNTKHTIGRPRLSLSRLPADSLEFEGGADPKVAAKKRLVELTLQPGDEFDPGRQQAMLDAFKIIDPGYQALLAERAELEASRSRGVQKVMVCSDGRKVKPMRHHTNSGKVPDFYETTYFLNRGDPRQKGEAAPLGFLQVLSRGEAPGTDAGGRVALADWITDTEHGAGHLLARVIVNRLWQHHFGEGIVSTPNDFGFQGERPTHPELLDWLALQLIENGWSLKHVHRLIVHSDAYRAERAPRRLPAEAIRDAALSVSGQLDPTMFGAGSLDEGMKRRSIYFQVKRSKLVPVMQMFDWPDTLTSLGKRAVTTTPSQALVFINSPHLRALAEAFANRVADFQSPVHGAYQIAYLRDPSESELAAAERFIAEQTRSHAGDRNKALADFCAALMSANEFIYIE